MKPLRPSDVLLWPTGPAGESEEARVARWRRLVDDEELLPDSLLDEALQRLLEVVHDVHGPRHFGRDVSG